MPRRSHRNHTPVFKSEVALAAIKGDKTEADLNVFQQMLTKITVEAALNAELDDHLGFDKHEQSDSDNQRNGVTHKTLQTEDGQFELAKPRDQAGSFEPQLVKKASASIYLDG